MRQIANYREKISLMTSNKFTVSYEIISEIIPEKHRQPKKKLLLLPVYHINNLSNFNISSQNHAHMLQFYAYRKKSCIKFDQI